MTVSIGFTNTGNALATGCRDPKVSNRLAAALRTSGLLPLKVRADWPVEAGLRRLP
jgi:hypothetical protein